MPRKLSFPDGTQEIPSHSSMDAVDSITHVGEATIDPLSEKFEIKNAKVLIISNNFYGTSIERVGNEVDRESMKSLFKDLGFYIEVLEDSKEKNIGLTKEIVEIKLKEWSENICGVLDGADALIVVIMSHGGQLEREKEDCIFLDYGEKIKLSDIYKMFSSNRCKALQGKPKLFFIEACRGHKQDRAVACGTESRGVVPDTIKRNDVFIANMAEFFIAQCCFPGYEGYLTTGGSWFIQAINKVFRSGIPKNKELHQMMIEVNRKVSIDYDVKYAEGEIGTSHVIKEVPTFFSALTKEVFFLIKDSS